MAPEITVTHNGDELVLEKVLFEQDTQDLPCTNTIDVQTRHENDEFTYRMRRRRSFDFLEDLGVIIGGYIHALALVWDVVGEVGPK